MMWLVTVAHFWWDGEKFRYAFSHMISIASFLDLTLRMFRPPSRMGLQSVAMAILGLVPCSHMKVLMMFIRASSMCIGIP